MREQENPPHIKAFELCGRGVSEVSAEIEATRINIEYYVRHKL